VGGFLEAVEQYTERVGDLDENGNPYTWTHPDIRDKASDAHRVLETVLPQILPKYQNRVTTSETRRQNSPRQNT